MYVEMRDTVFGVHVVTEGTVVELNVIAVCFRGCMMVMIMLMNNNNDNNKFIMNRYIPVAAAALLTIPPGYLTP